MHQSQTATDLDAIIDEGGGGGGGGFAPDEGPNYFGISRAGGAGGEGPCPLGVSPAPCKQPW